MSFTWFDSFGECLGCLEAPARHELEIAIAEYGMFGIEPEFDSPMMQALFVALRHDVDNSLRSSKAGKSGEGARKAPSGTPLPETEKGGSGTPLPETEKGGSGTPFAEISETRQGKARQGKARQGKGREETAPSGAAKKNGAKTARFSPPTPAEVEAYAEVRRQADPSLPAVDGERFCDFYGSKGWVVGKSPMKDWKAAVRNWQRERGQPRAQAARMDETAEVWL